MGEESLPWGWRQGSRLALLLVLPGDLAPGQDVPLHGQQELLLGGRLRQVQGGVQGEHLDQVAAGDSLGRAGTGVAKLAARVGQLQPLAPHLPGVGLVF